MKFHNRQSGVGMMGVMMAVAATSIVGVLASGALSNQMKQVRRAQEKLVATQLTRSVRSLAMFDVLPTVVGNCGSGLSSAKNNLHGTTVFSFWKVYTKNYKGACKPEVGIGTNPHIFRFDHRPAQNESSHYQPPGQCHQVYQ